MSFSLSVSLYTFFPLKFYFCSRLLYLRFKNFSYSAFSSPSLLLFCCIALSNSPWIL